MFLKNLTFPGFKKFNFYTFIFILIFSFLIRFIFLLLNPNYYNTHYEGNLHPEHIYFKNPNYGVPDSHEYKALAINIIKKHKFSWDDEPVTFRTPFYPFFISLVFLIFGIKDFPVMFFQVIFSTITVYIVYLIAKKVYNEKIALISSILFTFDPLSILYSSLYMSETIFIFLFLLSIYFFVIKNYGISALFLSLSSLTRPISLYSFLIFLPFLKKIKNMILFFLIFSILPFLWSLRNYKNYKVFKFTSIDGFNLLYHNAAVFESLKKNIPLEEVRNSFSKTFFENLKEEDNPLKLSIHASKIALNKILKEPFCYLFFHLKTCFKIIFSTQSEDILLKIKGEKKETFGFYKDVINGNVKGIYKYVIILFCFIEILLAFLIIFSGVLFAFIKRGKFEILSLFLIFYFFILSGMLGEARFRFPIISISYILFSAFLFKIFNKNEV